ncbi:MAG: thiamine phosphate synthase [Planctomycetales bacterium]|nr:thiamine phosphate synthase [Planctomycetales bacterium]
MKTEPDNPKRVPTDTMGALRIVDAAANRAAEGIRVVEDFARFALDDALLTSIAKSLRHELATALSAMDQTELLAARDSLVDVGEAIKTPAERQRSDMATIVTAGFKRLQQALRTLEEYAKLIQPSTATTIEGLRYRSYTLEKALVATQRGRERLSAAKLYVLLDGGSSEAEFRRQVDTLVAAGTDILQIRDKTLDDRTLLTRARLLCELTRQSNTLAVVNDRADIAALSRADGVHVGQDELTVKQVRAIVGPKPLIGVSTHGIEQARRAVLDGADYIGVGPTFPSTTKSFDDFPGLEFVRQVAEEISLPAFAIGGISLEHIAEVQGAGLNRVAVGAAITQAVDPAAQVRIFRDRLEAAGKPILQQEAATECK